jgi:2-polyprenyl-6-methoxyphenol hydroxylase-like FAD-dependent oxidoreductase
MVHGNSLSTNIAHAADDCNSPPNGEGVNVALHDSLQLAQQIIELGVEHLHEAAEAYEKLMLPRARATMDDSRIMDGLMFAEDAPTELLNMFETMGGSANA